MKKLLAILALVFCVGAATAQEAPSNNIGYLGYNFEGNHGVFVGLGVSVGKVSVYPYTRIGFDQSLEGVTFSKSTGIEVAYFAFNGVNWRVGLLANVAEVNWLEAQDQELGVYLSQTGGLIGAYDLTANIGVAGWLKARSQLFETGTAFKDRVTVGSALFVRL